MYIHGFEGSWFSHPFWRTRFLLERPEDLAAVLASEVQAVVIDVERGIGPADSPSAPRAATPRGPAAPIIVPVAPRDTMKTDRELAKKTIARGNRAV
jgi:hypothetical protein